jgi:hypothetical protein
MEMRRKKKTKPHLKDKLIPLVIGVTGHRDLRREDLPGLERVVRRVLLRLGKQYPNTPLLVLSPLAEGADRLVARVARKAEVALIVPLPMRSELYELDFADEASRAEFKDLLGYAESSFTLPPAGAISEKELRSHSEVRDRQYEQVGAYIVRHSQILLALWDGKDSSLVGGTSRIVKFQIEGVPEPYAPPRNFFDEVDSGPVYHVVTPRLKNVRPKGRPFTIEKLFPSRYADETKAQKYKAFQQIYKNIDTFNFNKRNASRLAHEIRKSKSDLFPESEAQELPTFLQSLRDRYAIADSLAIHFRKITDRTLLGLYGLVFLAAIVFGIYAHLWADQHAILLGYLLITGTAYKWVYRRAKNKNFENKYQDYRALAEGMRVQFFWCLANLHLSAAEHYLRKQRSELDWICSAISAWTVPVETEGWGEIHSDPASASRLNLILKHWVKAEAEYYKDAAEREKKRLEKYEPWTRYFLLFGVGLAIILVLTLWLNPWRCKWQDWLDQRDGLHHTLIILLALPPVAAALLHSYLDKAAFSEHFKQYTRMRVIFLNAERRLKGLINDEEKSNEAQQAIEALGKEALVENGDWVLLHRERPLEMVQ